MEDTTQVSSPASVELSVSASPSSAAANRSPLGWFVAGAIIGALLAVGTLTVINAARTPGRAAQVAAAPSSAPIDTAAGASANVNVDQAKGANGQTVDPNAMALSSERPFAPKVLARPENTQGKTDAPVLIIEYSDFNCGFCRHFHNDTLNQVIDIYVKTGKARFSYKHYPFLAPSSPLKAAAAECAAEQGKFWDFHEALFNNLADIKDEAAARDAVNRMAGDLKLDTAKFKTCLEGSAASARVQADLQEGQQLGITGTPAFLINGKPLIGAQPFSAFQKAIDAALAEKQKN